MAKIQWDVPVIKGTNIVWTEVWSTYTYDVEIDEFTFINPNEYQFNATLKFIGIRKGYGSGCKVFVEDTERTYIDKYGREQPVIYGIFLTDSYDVIIEMDHGIMSGTFRVCKRGQDYGIKLLKNENND